MSTNLRILCCTILCALACANEKPAAPAAQLELVAEGFVSPLTVVEPPDATERLFVLDQVGKIWILEAGGEKLPEPFLDISDKLVDLNPLYDERGLLGLAFHPEYASNGRFYVFYSAPLRQHAPEGFDHTNILAEYQVSKGEPDRADVDSERRLLEIDHPYANHNAGTLAFGPDGMLYVALGDGGNRDDEDQGTVHGHAEDWYEVNPGGNGQDIEDNLLGSILRIDVDGSPYAVPEDNPFVGVAGVLPEIWAYGFRNPYRFTFDPDDPNVLIVGDVGQERYEEITRVRAGSNHGWNVYEGTLCFDSFRPLSPLDSCPAVVGPGHPDEGAPLVPPVLALKNSLAFAKEGLGLAVIGGVVGRGESVPPAYRGRYVFGMWSGGVKNLHGRLFVATMSTDDSWTWEPVRLPGSPHGNLDGYLLGFGQASDGDVFVLTNEKVGPTGQTGKVHRLVEVTSE